MHPAYPPTIEEAIVALCQDLPLGALEELAATRQRCIRGFYDEYLPIIQASLGLWDGNEALMKACNQTDPEAAAAVTLEALWFRLQELLDETL